MLVQERTGPGEALIALLVASAILLTIFGGSRTPAAWAQNPTRTNLPARMRRVARARPGYYTAKGTYPEFSGARISPVVQTANDLLKTEARQEVERFVNESRQWFAKEGKPERAYEWESVSQVSLARPSLISVSFEIYSDSGGVHPNTTVRTFNVGRVGTGSRVQVRRLTFMDLLKPGANHKEAIIKRIVAKLKATEGAMWLRDGTVTERSPQLTQDFVLTPDAIVFRYPPYRVGPYVAGDFKVRLTYVSLRDHLNPNGPLQELLKGY